MKKEITLTLTNNMQTIEEEIITPKIKEFLDKYEEEVTLIQKLRAVDPQLAQMLSQKVRNKYKEEIVGVIPEQEITFTLDYLFTFNVADIFVKSIVLTSKVTPDIPLTFITMAKDGLLKNVLSKKSFEVLKKEYEEVDKELDTLIQRERDLQECQRLAEEVKDEKIGEKLLKKLEEIGKSFRGE